MGSMSTSVYAIRLEGVGPDGPETLVGEFLKQMGSEPSFQLLRNAELPEVVHFVRFPEDNNETKFADRFIEYVNSLDTAKGPVEAGGKLKAVAVADEESLESQLPGNLYIRGLLPSTTSDDLYQIFSPYGEIQSCKIIYDDYGFSKGYGFINFINKAQANAAIESLNGSQVNGNQLFVNHHVSKRDRLRELELKKQNYCNLYLKNVPPKVSKEELDELFGKYGPIDSIFLPRSDLQQDENKGYGFINYKQHESALNALTALNGHEIRPGYHLQIGPAERKKDRYQYQSLQNDDIAPVSPATSPNVAPAVAVAMASSGSSGSAVSSPPATLVPPFMISPDSNLISTATGLPIAGPEYQDSNLYITHLPLEFNDTALHQLFDPFGPIISAKVITYQRNKRSGEVDAHPHSKDARGKDPETLIGKSKGFGFVCFSKPVYASRAMVAMNGYRLDDTHMLNISFAQRKENKFERGRLHHYNQNSLGNVYKYLNYQPLAFPPPMGYYPPIYENKENGEQQGFYPYPYYAYDPYEADDDDDD